MQIHVTGVTEICSSFFKLRYTLKRFRVSKGTPSGVVTRWWCNESTGSPQEHQQSEALIERYSKFILRNI